MNGGQRGLWGTVTANIDLTGAAYGGSTDAPLQWKPMGSEYMPYTATFDGGGKTISYMAIDGRVNFYQSYQGFFGSAANATIKNVHIGESSHVVNYDRCGGVVGAMNGGTLENCSNAGLGHLPVKTRRRGELPSGKPEGGGGILLPAGREACIVALSLIHIWAP